MDHGVVTDWDDMERIWHHLFMKVPLIYLVRGLDLHISWLGHDMELWQFAFGIICIGAI